MVIGSTVAIIPSLFNGPAMLASVTGAIALTAGISRGSRPLVNAGALGLYIGILLAGITNARPVMLLAAAAGAVVAWDTAENAVVLSDQLCPQVDTRRTESIHAAATASIVSAAAVGGYLVYVAVSMPRPTVVLVVLLVAVLLLVSVLIRR